jgi:phenylalanyl-tRNA synthetase alpha chain
VLAKLSRLKEEAQTKILSADNINALQELRIFFLGKKGELTSVLRGMGALSAEERPLVGKEVNEVRDFIEQQLEEKTQTLKKILRAEKLLVEKIDVTLPGKNKYLGKRHPLYQVMDEIKNIFIRMGYSIAEGPEIELDYYNFEALNLPPNHPARDMQDSFYITPDVLLRTHTSPVQARFYEKTSPALPVKIIAPGKVYRCDDDATHSPMFHQVEGFLIDQHVTLADLKGTLLTFAKEMFGDAREIRLRPSFFPFTEPSAEVDISCFVCDGKGCRLCKGTGWIEILGAGMVHPRVLEMGGYDPAKVSGFAFGMGVERVTMLKYGIDDLRLFFENDIRFLSQF